MKINYLILTIFLLSMISCNDIIEDSQMSEISHLHKEQADKRSYEEAIRIAQQSISMLDSSLVTTRGTTQARQIDLHKTTAIVCSNDMVTRSSDSPENDTLMYVFNFNDNQGFAVVSAEESTEGLIAITESGSYNPSDTTDSGFNRFMAAAKLYILANKDKKKNNLTRAQVGQLERVDTIGIYSISPRITVKWGQTGHEGEFCSNGVSGCMHTAAAMIMSYFEYPTGISLTYEDAPYTYRALNWSGIKSFVGKYEYIPTHDYDLCMNEDHKSIGYLCRELAHKTGDNFNYNPLGTSANMLDLRNALISYGYSVGDITYYQNLVNTTTVENHLSDGKLILMAGVSSLGGGHAWVIDGFYRYTIHYRRYEYTPNNELPDFPLLTLIEEQYNQYRYNHINWGGNGYNNGFFSDGVFSFYGNAYSYDSSNYIGTTNNNNLITENNFSVNVNFITIYKD